jgi:hypothetical protein
MSPHALALSFAAAALLCSADPADARGRQGTVGVGVQAAHHHHAGHWRHRGHHRHWDGGVWLGLGLGWAYGPDWRDPWYPREIVVERVVPAPPPAAPAVPAAPDPQFVPNEGQDARQTEADRQACNRWTMTQADAVADAQVFHRTSLACMEARGYTVR